MSTPVHLSFSPIELDTDIHRLFLHNGSFHIEMRNYLTEKYNDFLKLHPDILFLMKNPICKSMSYLTEFTDWDTKTNIGQQFPYSQPKSQLRDYNAIKIKIIFIDELSNKLKIKIKHSDNIYSLIKYTIPGLPIVESSASEFNIKISYNDELLNSKYLQDEWDLFYDFIFDLTDDIKTKFGNIMGYSHPYSF
jgi:hypothetical protein